MTPAEFRAWYQGRGWTQTQTADALGLPQQRVSEMARGAAPVRPIVARIIELLDRVEHLEAATAAEERG